MLEIYAKAIEAIFYLKENQNLSDKERNEKIKGVLKSLKDECKQIGHSIATREFQEALHQIKTKP